VTFGRILFAYRKWLSFHENPFPMGAEEKQKLK
jgi:hypothetical protein